MYLLHPYFRLAGLTSYAKFWKGPYGSVLEYVFSWVRIHFQLRFPVKGADEARLQSGFWGTWSFEHRMHSCTGVCPEPEKGHCLLALLCTAWKVRASVTGEDSSCLRAGKVDILCTICIAQTDSAVIAFSWIKWPDGSVCCQLPAHRAGKALLVWGERSPDFQQHARCPPSLPRCHDLLWRASLNPTESRNSCYYLGLHCVHSHLGEEQNTTKRPSQV